MISPLPTTERITRAAGALGQQKGRKRRDEPRAALLCTGKMDLVLALKPALPVVKMQSVEFLSELERTEVHRRAVVPLHRVQEPAPDIAPQKLLVTDIAPQNPEERLRNS